MADQEAHSRQQALLSTLAYHQTVRPLQQALSPPETASGFSGRVGMARRISPSPAYTPSRWATYHTAQGSHSHKCSNTITHRGRDTSARAGLQIADTQRTCPYNPVCALVQEVLTTRKGHYHEGPAQKVTHRIRQPRLGLQRGPCKRVARRSRTVRIRCSNYNSLHPAANTVQDHHYPEKKIYTTPALLSSQHTMQAATTI